jgi:tetratricopeptide (TPR) repeat protein
LAGLSAPAAEHLLWQLHDAHLISLNRDGYVGFHELVRLSAAAHELPARPAAECKAALIRLLNLAVFQAAACHSLLSPHRYQPPVTQLERPDGAEVFADRATALAWLDAEWPNLVALCGLASAHEHHERCWQLAFFLRDYFFHAKLWTPWVDTHLLALSSAELTANRWAAATTLNNLGMAHMDRGDAHEAQACYTRALEQFLILADEHGTATAQCNLAWASLYLGNYGTALRHLTEALDFYKRTGATRSIAITLRGIALTETELGSFADALRHAEEAGGTARELDLELDTTMALNCIAWIHFRAHRYQEAAAFYAQAVDSGERCGSLHEIARARTGLGNIAAALRDHAKAAQLWSLAESAAGDLSPVSVGEARARFASNAAIGR